VTDTLKQLRLNVGLLINRSVGYSRDFDVDVPFIHLEPDLDLYDLSGSVHATRTSRGILLQADMRAYIVTECVRCLTEFNLPLHAEFTELYAFSRNSVDESDLVLPEEAKIDLAPILREYMILEIPIKPVCGVECRGLCPICGEPFTHNHHDHEPESIDPRLAVLKTLLK
jgi:uncharacterized protein